MAPVSLKLGLRLKTQENMRWFIMWEYFRVSLGNQGFYISAQKFKTSYGLNYFWSFLDSKLNPTRLGGHWHVLIFYIYPCQMAKWKWVWKFWKGRIMHKAQKDSCKKASCREKPLNKKTSLLVMGQSRKSSCVGIVN